jgi:hypothetical protein
MVKQTYKINDKPSMPTINADNVREWITQHAPEERLASNNNVK